MNYPIMKLLESESRAAAPAPRSGRAQLFGAISIAAKSQMRIYISLTVKTTALLEGGKMAKFLELSLLQN